MYSRVKNIVHHCQIPLLTALIALTFLILPALTNIAAVHAHDCGPVAVTMNVGETPPGRLRLI